MITHLINEINTLKEIMKERFIETDFNTATINEIKEIEKMTGIKLTNDMKDFFMLMNGSNYEDVALVKSDQLSPVHFLSIEEIMDYYDNDTDRVVDCYDASEEELEALDKRIQPYLRHKHWLPIASFNGGSTLVYFDADPTDKGVYGQIIVYQHDPDYIYYVAESITEFLSISNKLMKKENIILKEYVSFIENFMKENADLLIRTNKIKNTTVEEIERVRTDLLQKPDEITKEALWSDLGVSPTQTECIYDGYWFISINGHMYNFDIFIEMDKEEKEVTQIYIDSITKYKQITIYNERGIPCSASEKVSL